MNRIDWETVILCVLVLVFILATLIISGWMDMEQNKVINECIRAGHTWKDGNCG